MLNMFRTLIHPSLGACDFSIVSPLQPNHTETPTHIETRTHDQCCDTIEKSQAPDDGCINVQNLLSIEEVKWNIITSDIKLGLLFLNYEFIGYVHMFFVICFDINTWTV